MNLRTVCTAITLALSPFAASAQSPQLKSVLSQMDAASAHFKSAQADVRYDNYTRVVNDHTLNTGSIYIERTGGGAEQMGAISYPLDPSGQPAKTPANIISFDGATLRIYTPGTNQVDIFKAGANQAKYNSFLTLGFGGSGRDLAASWNINDQGPETVDGIKTEKLDLVSKDPSVKNLFSHVTIWIDPVRGLSLKQIFFAPNGDNRTATYSNLRLNSRINKRPYDIPKGATPIQH
jgi:outer membrane lipoprotein-sorting protein